MLEAIKELLSQGWVGGLLGAVGFIGTIVGLVFAYYFYRKSLRLPKLLHYVHGFQVAGGPRLREAGEHLEVRFKGEPIERLDIAWVAIWNGGTGTLEGSMLVPHDPLRIEIPEDGELLDAAIIRVARDVNRIELGTPGEDKKSVPLTFDFLDPGDGVLVKVLHSSHNGASPSVAGVLKGTPVSPVRAPRIENLRYPARRYSVAQSVVWLGMSVVLAAFAFMPDSAFAYLNTTFPGKDANGHPSAWVRALYLLMALVQFVFWVVWRRERRPPVPLALRTPEDEARSDNGTRTFQTIAAILGKFAERSVAR